MRKEKFITEIGLRRRRFHLLFLGSKIAVVLTLIFFVVLGFLTYFPLFKVRSVQIEGASYIPRGRIESLVQSRIMAGSTVEHFLGSGNMLVWPDRLQEEDLSFLPEASAINIEKNYWKGTIKVSVSERVHEGIWCFREVQPSRCYWFDEKGLITRTPYTEGSLFLVVNDYARETIPHGEPIVQKEHLANLFSIFEALERMEITPKEIRLENLALEEVRVPTFDGPSLLFSLRFSAGNTPASFEALAKKTNILNLEYVDFRVDNRIYYK